MIMSIKCSGRGGGGGGGVGYVCVWGGAKMAPFLFMVFFSFSSWIKLMQNWSLLKGINKWQFVRKSINALKFE